jgi:hypothetical protein
MDAPAAVVSLAKLAFAQLIPNSRKAPLPPGWQFLKRVPTVRLCDGAKLIKALITHTTRDKLIEAHLAIAANSEELVPSNVLSSRLFLRRAAGDGGYDVENQHGSLFTTESVLSLPGRWPLAGADGSPSRIILAANNHDAHILASSGFDVLSIRNILSLTPPKVRVMSHSSKGNNVRHRCVIPAWSVATIHGQPSLQMQLALERLQKLELVTNRKLDSVFDVWVPTAHELTWLAAARDLQDRHAVRQVLTSSLGGSVYSLTAYCRRLSATRAVDPRAAMKQLAQVVRHTERCGSDRGLAEALDEARRAFCVAFLLPEPETSKRRVDPLQQAYAFELSVILEQQFEDQPLIKQAHRILAGDVYARSELPTVDSVRVATQWRVDTLSKLKKLYGEFSN